MATIFLIHGGLWEDMDAERFWIRPGVSAALSEMGHEVLVPDRIRQPQTWQDEVDHLAPMLPDRVVTVVAGSNGCSAGAQLALAFPGTVKRLVLAWPAGAGDAQADDRYRAQFDRRGAPPEVSAALLAGQTLRGLADAELPGLRAAVAVLPAQPANLFHRQQTVSRLLELIPNAAQLPGSPEPPRPEFAAYLDAFVSAVHQFASGY